MEANQQFTFPPLPVIVTQLPITRRQVCYRIVANWPGTITEVLTEHHRRAIPERLMPHPGSRSRRLRPIEVRLRKSGRPIRGCTRNRSSGKPRSTWERRLHCAAAQAVARVAPGPAVLTVAGRG